MFKMRRSRMFSIILTFGLISVLFGSVMGTLFLWLSNTPFIADTINHVIKLYFMVGLGIVALITGIVYVMGINEDKPDMYNHYEYINIRFINYVIMLVLIPITPFIFTNIAYLIILGTSIAYSILNLISACLVYRNNKE